MKFKKLLLCLPFLFSSAAILQADFTRQGDGLVIQDNTSKVSTITIGEEDNEIIEDLHVTLNDLEHGWIGDLVITLRHVETATVMPLMNRIKKAPSDGPGDSSNFSGTYSIRDGGSDIWQEAGNGGTDFVLPTASIQSYAATNVAGDPVSFASLFAGQSTSGNWELFVQDSATSDEGTLGSWEITFEIQAIPEPAGFLCGVIGLGLFRRRRRS